MCTSLIFFVVIVTFFFLIDYDIVHSFLIFLDKNFGYGPIMD